MKKLVLLRHGESQWNKENRFTGWVDIPLSTAGLEEAHAAAALLKQEGYVFDVAYTSVLTRAIKTLWVVLEDLGLAWIPVHNSWRLNERMYGALQGLNKVEMARVHGEAQVQLWRRSYEVPPPPLDESSPMWPGRDARYHSVPVAELPRSECLKDTVSRFLPYWHEHIAPALRRNEKVLIAAHGNSLRALIKYLSKVSDADIVELNVPTAVPIVYELDDALQPTAPFSFLGDAEVAAQKARAVAAQAKT